VFIAEEEWQTYAMWSIHDFEVEEKIGQSMFVCVLEEICQKR